MSLKGSLKPQRGFPVGDRNGNSMGTSQKGKSLDGCPCVTSQKCDTRHLMTRERREVIAGDQVGPSWGPFPRIPTRNEFSHTAKLTRFGCRLEAESEVWRTLQRHYRFRPDRSKVGRRRSAPRRRHIWHKTNTHSALLRRHQWRHKLWIGRTEWATALVADRRVARFANTF